MERHLPILVMFSFFGLIIGLLLIIPDEDALPVLIYLIVALFLAVILFNKGIKPVDPDFPPALFALALIIKLASGAVRYWTAFDLYEGYTDAKGYHDMGQRFAGFFRQFDFSILDSIPQGTEGLGYVTGVFYTFLPQSMPGSFFFFSTLAFTGSVFFYRAFRIGFSEASPNLFRFIVFFLPSILYWPAGLGKDAWVFFSSGFVVYGLAAYVHQQNRLSNLIVAGLGIFLVSLARSHIALVMVASICIAYFVGQGIRGIKPLLGGILVIIFGFIVFQYSTEYLTNVKGLSEVSWGGIQEFYDEQQQATFRGGSRFAPVIIFTLLGPFYALVTVLFRPFLWEAENLQMLIVSVESLLWLWLFWSCRQNFFSRSRLMTKNALIGFLIIYSVILILALTAIGNFGILARQRVMLIPFLWMLFA